MRVSCSVAVIAIALASGAARADDLGLAPDLSLHRAADLAPADTPRDPGDPHGAIAALVAGAAVNHDDPPLIGEGEITVHVARDGSATIVDGPNIRLGPRRGPPVDADPAGAVVLSFDVTDALMRRHGMDPYASAKLRALDASRPARIAAGLAYRERRLAATAPLVASNIARALALPTPALQRRALLELAAECATTGPADIVDAGRLARALIDAVLAHRFP